MCRKCVTEEMASKIELVQDIGSDFPDGAFLALCEENEVDVTDLAEYYEEHKQGGHMKIICAWCKRILKDGVGDVSHGICKECSRSIESKKSIK